MKNIMPESKRRELRRRHEDFRGQHDKSQVAGAPILQGPWKFASEVTDGQVTAKGGCLGGTRSGFASKG